jgi:succinoglycan biosynthesis transport protein ExoP
MSRILEALRKAEIGRVPLAGTLPRSAEARAHAEAEVAAATAATAALPEPETPSVPVWSDPAMPDLPEDFERELAGLRQQVDAALAGRRPRVLLMTASTSGEGTTTVAACFARVLAQDPAARVLLVDANTHRPGVALFFGLPAGPGLAQALAAGMPVAGLVRPVERHNLHVLPAMAGEEGAARLLTQPLLRRFLGEFGARYDYVVFDAPPVLEAPETVVLGSAVDTSILVLRAASTKTGVINRAVDSLAKAGVPLLGVVLNRRRLDIPEFIYKRI